jgi:hypothetical protein
MNCRKCKEVLFKKTSNEVIDCSISSLKCTKAECGTAMNISIFVRMQTPAIELY